MECVCVCVCAKTVYTHYPFLNVIIFIPLLNKLFESHHCLQYKHHLKAYETLNNEYTGFKSASRYCSPIILFSLTDITSRGNESPSEPAHLYSPTRAPTANSQTLKVYISRRAANDRASLRICTASPGHPPLARSGAYWTPNIKSCLFNTMDPPTAAKMKIFR